LGVQREPPAEEPYSTFSFRRRPRGSRCNVLPSSLERGQAVDLRLEP